MKKIFSLIFIFILSDLLIAQRPSNIPNIKKIKIIGNVVDQETNQPLEYATITLSNPINTTFSNSTAILTIRDDDKSDLFLPGNAIASQIGGAHGLVKSDIDQDGDDDLIIANWGGGEQHYSSSNSAGNVLWLKNNVVDINGDGNGDILSANFDQGYTTNLVVSESFSLLPIFSPPLPTIFNEHAQDKPSDVAIGDLDNDGDFDIAVASYLSNTIRWLENDGQTNPSFVEHILSTSEVTAHGIRIADINDDGNLDIISAAIGTNYGDISKTGRLALFTNNGEDQPSFDLTVVSPSADSENTAFSDVDFGDMDGDGDMDLVTGTINSSIGVTGRNDTIEWHENNNGSWILHPIADNVLSVRGVDVADMDGDGDLDILSASYHDNKIAWYENDGLANPTFNDEDIDTRVVAAHDVEAADLDNDGDIDIIAASEHYGEMNWWDNNGAFDPQWIRTPMKTNVTHDWGEGVWGAQDIVPVDLDGDGDLDVVAAGKKETYSFYPSDNAVYFFENISSGKNAPLIFSDLDYGATPTLSIADVTTVNENNANATFTVSLSAISNKDVGVDYATSNGTAIGRVGYLANDYDPTSGTLTIPAGQTSATFNVRVNWDKRHEGN